MLSVLPSVRAGGHKSAVTAVAFGPDAQWICSASADRNLRFFGKA
jgi:WD40 repeat protein